MKLRAERLANIEEWWRKIKEGKPLDWWLPGKVKSMPSFVEVDYPNRIPLCNFLNNDVDYLFSLIQDQDADLVACRAHLAALQEAAREVVKLSPAPYILKDTISECPHCNSMQHLQGLLAEPEAVVVKCNLKYDYDTDDGGNIFHYLQGSHEDEEYAIDLTLYSKLCDQLGGASADGKEVTVVILKGRSEG